MTFWFITSLNFSLNCLLCHYFFSNDDIMSSNIFIPETAEKHQRHSGEGILVHASLQLLNFLQTWVPKTLFEKYQNKFKTGSLNTRLSLENNNEYLKVI